MLEKIKKLIQKRQFSEKLIAIFIIVIAISVWFYWSQYRPTEIRKDCVKYANEHIKVEKGSKVDINKFIKANDFVYKECLKMRGLK